MHAVDNKWDWKCEDCDISFHGEGYNFCFRCGRERPYHLQMQQAEDDVRNPPLEHRVEALEKLYEKTVMLEESLRIGQRFLCERIGRLEPVDEEDEGAED